MAKAKKDCKKCIYNGEKCKHESNKGFIVQYRHETETFFDAPEQININGDCINYAELPEK